MQPCRFTLGTANLHLSGLCSTEWNFVVHSDIKSSLYARPASNVMITSSSTQTGTWFSLLDFPRRGLEQLGPVINRHTSYQSDWSFWMQCQTVEQPAYTETRGSSPCSEEVRAQQKRCRWHPVFLREAHRNCGPAGTDLIPTARASHVPCGDWCIWQPSSEWHWWDWELWGRRIILQTWHSSSSKNRQNKASISNLTYLTTLE